MSIAAITLTVFIVIALGVLSAFAQTQISDKVVVLTTKSGEMVIELFPEDAPRTVENFLNLTENNFYDRTIFHRVIKDFMIQGGDPKTKPGAYERVEEWGTGDSGQTIPGEFNTIMHTRGIVSMARGLDPDSASSQFFIVHKDSPHLDQNYAAFGRLATNSSYATLDKIASLETGGEDTNHIPFMWGEGEILKAEVKNRSEIPDLLQFEEPKRVETPSEQTPQKYSNPTLGISFNAPAGWFVQQPPKTSPQTPDVVAVGGKIGGFTPAISVSIKNTNGTSIDAYADLVKATLKPALDAGTVEIVDERKTTINGNEAFVREVDGEFDLPTGTMNVRFEEVILKIGNKFYILTYTNSENDFAKTKPKFDATVNSFEVLGTVTVPPETPDETTNGGGCLIATAAYGTETASQIQMLREMRQNILLNTDSGTTFMSAFNQFYYSFSPTVADWERQNPFFKESVRIAISPMLYSLTILNYADSEQELLGYGIAVILLNTAFYLALPAALILKVREYKRK